MSNSIESTAPMQGVVVACVVEQGSRVSQGETLLVLEAMKVQTSINAACSGIVAKLLVQEGDIVEKNALLFTLDEGDFDGVSVKKANVQHESSDKNAAIEQLSLRINKTLDKNRGAAVEKRHSRGYRTARENLADLCDIESFVEYGQLAIAAQRQRISYEKLQSSTAADGIITGIGSVNASEVGEQNSKTALVINDYSVLAGTQGFFHHKKLDRILEQALNAKLPVIMYTEGGGGRPGDTDVLVVNSGLQCASFSSWAALSGVVPRIAVGNGYNFAGNAALFGAADITIATKNSWIGMAGPAMISGGGLGDFSPKEIGPSDVQTTNGVVDILADDEQHASRLAKQCLSYFQSDVRNWEADQQESIIEHLPESRRSTYSIREIIKQLADTNSVLELKQGYGGAIITCFARFEGRAVGLIANDCTVLGGAIDVDAGEKAAEFINLCNDFKLPLISLCDTPGFMVGPEHEERGAVRRLAKLFTAGAKLSTPLLAIVIRKCYGLGAQAMVGGSTAKPNYIAAWPTGEFGPMGLEGAVELGYKKELDAEPDPAKRKDLFDKLLAREYERGQATEVATAIEVDAVIDPAATRARLISMLASSVKQ